MLKFFGLLTFVFIFQRFSYNELREKSESYFISIVISNCISVFYLILLLYWFIFNKVVVNIRGIIGLVIIVGIIVYSVIYALNEKKSEYEFSILPSKLQNYVANHGYTPTQVLINYCMTAPEFESSRRVKYKNPEYDAVTKSKKGKPSKQTETPPQKYIPLYKIIHIPYKDVVIEKTKEYIRSIIPTFYVFDIDDLYEKASDFHSYYENDNGNNLTDVFRYNAYTVVLNEFNDKYKMLSSPSSNDKIYNATFKSKLSEEQFNQISGCESNVVEGETLEISFDD